jgi:hypothetical protein
MCREHPIRKGSKTCGDFCGQRLRVKTLREQSETYFVAGVTKMRERKAVEDRKRLIELLAQEVRRIDEAPTMADKVKIAARIFRKGYGNGLSNAYQRYVVAPRRQSA